MCETRWNSIPTIYPQQKKATLEEMFVNWENKTIKNDCSSTRILKEIEKIKKSNRDTMRQIIETIPSEVTFKI